MDAESAGAGRHAAEAHEGARTSSMTAAGAIRVPSERVDELRLRVRRRRGCRRRGRIGFEIFDRTAFGATEFLEQVNYRRALEGEIARTICTHRRSVERPRAHRDGEGLAVRRAAAGQGVGRAEAARTAAGLSPSTIAGIAEPRRRQRRGTASRSGGDPRQLRPAARAPAEDGRRGDAAPRSSSASSGSSATVEHAGRRAARAGRRRGRVRVNVALKLNASPASRRRSAGTRTPSSAAGRRPPTRPRSRRVDRRRPDVRSNLPGEPADPKTPRASGAGHVSHSRDHELRSQPNDDADDSAAGRRRAHVGGGDPGRRPRAKKRQGRDVRP